MEDETKLFLDWIMENDTVTGASCCVKHDTYGDYIRYSDGTVEYINVGD